MQVLRILLQRILGWWPGRHAGQRSHHPVPSQPANKLPPPKCWSAREGLTIINFSTACSGRSAPRGVKKNSFKSPPAHCCRRKRVALGSERRSHWNCRTGTGESIDRHNCPVLEQNSNSFYRVDQSTNSQLLSAPMHVCQYNSTLLGPSDSCVSDHPRSPSWRPRQSWAPFHTWALTISCKRAGRAGHSTSASYYCIVRSLV